MAYVPQVIASNIITKADSNNEFINIAVASDLVKSGILKRIAKTKTVTVPAAGTVAEHTVELKYTALSLKSSADVTVGEWTKAFYGGESDAFGTAKQIFSICITGLLVIASIYAVK